MATALKERGNEALKLGKHDDAVRLYTEAIDLEPRNQYLFSNRAAAHAMAGQYDAALNDAQQVCVLAPDWIKGHVRKGAAFKSLKRYSEAAAAYQRALSLEPANAQVKAALAEVEGLQATMSGAGRNWADDLASSDDESAKNAPPARPRADAPGPSRKKMRTASAKPPSASELKAVQSALNDARAPALRACLLQLAKEDAAVCAQIVETVEELGEASSEGDNDEDKVDDKSSDDDGGMI